ncbi:hypothetical protein KK083_25155 [Fulvivirgaceae bacterium PWU4]|uniref:Uncharacterized protein n=1 Tax=Chryseosolibacter histidini TaxID=2782349 RepID=A0AAP2DPJ9_9BACT|nr:hypothetical protein [Chryseosolibacter histidini]MBT1700201.1 hypothetical protein [Chryseosolibacter histidini]
MMMLFFNTVRRWPRTWLWLAIVLMVLTGFLVSWSGRCLKTTSAPFAIVSLELAWDQRDADTIRNEWQRASCSHGNIISDPTVAAPGDISVIHTAQKNILDDLWFLMAYTLFFIVCVVRIDPFKLPDQPVTRTTFVFVQLALVAGLLDAIENFFMWRFISGEDIPSDAFAFPATVKFLLVITLTGYILLYLLRRLRSLVKS